MIRLKRFYAHDFKQLREMELHFPDAGRILVQGKNEAGKSTLFEAVYFALFGQALATESVGRPNLDDLIGYEKNKARVELDLAAGERLFRITRTLNRGKANVWELEITKGDQLEEIKGNRSVNDRLVLELGFDAEALLNTCFVEQKKLEKLEGLNKARREESLSKLLNLERLLDIEERLRIRSEDEKMLARLAKRVELAEAQEELPSAEKELAAAEGQLKLLELTVQIARALEEKRAASALAEQLRGLYTRREELRTGAASVDELDKARRAIVNATDRFDLVTQQRANLDALRQEQNEMSTAKREHLPVLERRSRELGRITRSMERLSTIDSARQAAGAELQRLQSIQQELVGVQERGRDFEAEIAQLQSRVNELDTHLRDFDIGDALGEWANFSEEMLRQADDGQSLKEKRRSRELASSRLRTGLVTASAIAVASVAATILLPLAVAFLFRNPVLALGISAGLVIVDAAGATVIIRHVRTLWEELEHAAAGLAKTEGEAAAREQLMTNSSEGLRGAERHLAELSVAIPLTPAAARSRRIEIAASLENKTREELNVERDETRTRLSYANARRDEILRQVRALQSDLEKVDLHRCQQTVTKAQVILNVWEPRLAARARELDNKPDLRALRDAKQETDSKRITLQMRIQQSTKLDTNIEEGETRIDKLSQELRRTYESARQLLDGRFVPWTPQLPRADYVALGNGLSEAFEAHGGDQVRANLNSAEKEIGACERELKLRDKAAEEAVGLTRSILGQLRIDDELGTEATAAELGQLAERFRQVQLDDRSMLELRVTSLQMRVGALRHTRDLLERELGLQGEVIDLVEVRDELQKERRQQQERGHGAEIVLRARKRIVQKVLPATMDYMRRILPQLTRDRYHDAELDPETYKIKVWDERAGQSGAWKEKNIFSGGTKDQFSLALRLAFALATLPQERGTSPGFIFLDEPLGSFDDERAAALLYLLTEGEIANAFDQIFLISHVRVREERFTHHIRLENGVSVDTNLNS
jgi:DNA repair protein SbcC/Rad50